MASMPIYALGDDEPQIHPDAFIHPEAVIIGRVRIGAHTSVWPGAVIRGDDGDVIIGERTSIQDGAVLHTTSVYFTTVGDDCVIGHLVHLEGCIIESGALVGSNSVVLHQAIVRSGALVGASALVPNGMEVPSRAMALGVPAKLRPDSVPDGMIAMSAKSYVDRSARYRTAMRRIG